MSATPPKAAIIYLVGDATEPHGDGPSIIAHICNDAGVWEAGFVKAISAKWPGPETTYRDWSTGKLPSFSLGAVMVVGVAPNLKVANMVAQHGVGGANGAPALRYEALERCLTTVATAAAKEGASVHMPRIGAGSAGGSWDEIAPIIERTLLAASIPVFVYDLAAPRA